MFRLLKKSGEVKTTVP